MHSELALPELHRQVFKIGKVAKKILQSFQSCLLLQLKSQEIPSTSAFTITEQLKNKKKIYKKI